MRKFIIMLLLLAAPITVGALELRMGMINYDSGLYEGIYGDTEMYGDDAIDDTGLVGRIEIGHEFRINKGFGINLFATHQSLWNEKDPHYGQNGVGAEFIFRFTD